MSSQWPYDLQFINLYLPLRKMGLQEVKAVAWYHRNPRLSDSKAHSFAHWICSTWEYGVWSEVMRVTVTNLPKQHSPSDARS